MGYYTNFDLEFDSSKENEVKTWLKENEDKFDYDIVDIIEGNSDSLKWYDHKEDMLIISNQFPDVLFILSGEGEENKDIWKEYYKGGKAQVAEAVFTIAEFDESRLE